MESFKIGDEVIDLTSGIYGIVIKQYYPTACEHQTMIQCYDGRKYHAPTKCFAKKDYLTNEQINKNECLNEIGKYAAKFARNHNISTSEALETKTVKAYGNVINSLHFGA